MVADARRLFVHDPDMDQGRTDALDKGVDQIHYQQRRPALPFEPFWRLAARRFGPAVDAMCVAFSENSARRPIIWLRVANLRLKPAGEPVDLGLLVGKLRCG